MTNSLARVCRKSSFYGLFNVIQLTIVSRRVSICNKNKIGWDSQQQRIDSFIYNSAFEWKKFKFVLSTTPIYFYTWTHIKWFRLMMSFYPIYRHTYYMLKSTNKYNLPYFE